MGADTGSVSGDDGSDDGEPESVPVSVVRPALIETLERLEEAVDFSWRDEWSVTDNTAWPFLTAVAACEPTLRTR